MSKKSLTYIWENFRQSNTILSYVLACFYKDGKKRKKKIFQDIDIYICIYMGVNTKL